MKTGLDWAKFDSVGIQEVSELVMAKGSIALDGLRRPERTDPDRL